ncbi:MAG: lactonase family protein [Chloroflexota bacterium]
MFAYRQFFSAALFSAAMLGGSSLVASAQDDHISGGAKRAVFVQTDDPAGNQVMAYYRANNGVLTLAATYDTGGKGARLNGAAVDPLASQGSLVYDSEHSLLIGVNAGSDSVYAFHVEGDRLSQREVLSSHGSLPVSVGVHDDLAYVANAGGEGGVHGYRIDDGRLTSIRGSSRSLGLTPFTDATQFLHTPGQVSFSPDGEHLIVTTKANGSHIDVFGVREDGLLTDTPVANPSATPVPFGISFDPSGRLVIAEAGASSVSTYVLRDNGTLTTIGSQPDNQAALCWVAAADGNFFGANAGSGNVSGFHLNADGRPSLIGTTSVGAGPIDLSASRGGEFLYVQLGGAGSVAELKVSDNGALTLIGTIATRAGQEGIVAV